MFWRIYEETMKLVELEVNYLGKSYLIIKLTYERTHWRLFLAIKPQIFIFSREKGKNVWKNFWLKFIQLHRKQ